MTTPTSLVSRQAETVAAHAPTAIAGLGGQLSEVMQMCNAIAAAGELIPRAYQGKPGAVLLAKMWADKHDVDVFTAIQNIDVIDGKPWVKTQMRVELAIGRGFEFKVTETTTEVCTVEVWHDAGGVPKQIGDPITARIDDRPRRLQYSSGKPTPWALHADDMLFAEACRKADKRYVRTGAGLLDAEQDYEDEPDADPVDVIQNDAWSATVEDELIAQGKTPTDAVDVAEAPEPETPPADDETPGEDMTGAQLRTRISGDKSRDVTVPKALRAVQGKFPDGGFADLDAVAADPQALDFVLGWIEGGGK